MNHTRVVGVSLFAGVLTILGGTILVSSAEAQPAPVPLAAPSALAPLAAPSALAPLAAPSALAPLAAPSALAPPPVRPPSPDLLVEALGLRSGGLTPDDAAKAALASRPSIEVKRAELTAAAARVDQALISYYPKLSLQASYTRSSPVESSLSLGPRALVTADNSGDLLTTAPCPAGGPSEGKTCVVDPRGAPVQAQGLAFEFPTVVSTYSLVASISLPVSDWVLRASQGLAAAAHAEKAKQIELEAERLQVAANAKITYFNWVRAKGQLAVATGAVAQAKAHLDDARRVLEVGLLSKADVLRLEADVAGVEVVRMEVEALSMLAERQLRQTIGAAPEKPLEVGIDVMAGPAAEPPGTLDSHIQQALTRRLEIRALDETQFALKDNESVTKAGYWPKVEAFADGVLANPNPRTFPQTPQWDFTWDAGLRLTWVVSDTFATAPAVAEAKARTAVVAAQRSALREGLELEVISAYSDMRRAARTIEAAERRLVAAEESMRVRAEMFRSGKASSVELIDAETEVTTSRLRRLDARVGYLVAKTRLDHATGRDVNDAKASKP